MYVRFLPCSSAGADEGQRLKHVQGTRVELCPNGGCHFDTRARTRSHTSTNALQVLRCWTMRPSVWFLAAEQIAIRFSRSGIEQQYLHVKLVMWSRCSSVLSYRGYCCNLSRSSIIKAGSVVFDQKKKKYGSVLYVVKEALVKKEEIE